MNEHHYLNRVIEEMLKSDPDAKKLATKLRHAADHDIHDVSHIYIFHDDCVFCNAERGD